MTTDRDRGDLLHGLCIMAGITTASLVYIGDKFQWTEFNQRSGYLGTEYLNSLLYAIHIVAFMWFSYGAASVFILGWGVRMVKDRFF